MRLCPACHAGEWSVISRQRSGFCLGLFLARNSEHSSPREYFPLFGSGITDSILYWSRGVPEQGLPIYIGPYYFQRKIRRRLILVLSLVAAVVPKYMIRKLRGIDTVPGLKLQFLRLSPSAQSGAKVRKATLIHHLRHVVASTLAIILEPNMFLIQFDLIPVFALLVVTSLVALV